MPTRFYRAGVGTVVYRPTGEIVIFKRSQHPVGAWELQQGGIDLGEVPEQTLWRELLEEIGVVQDDIEHYEMMPRQTMYQSPLAADSSVPVLGQVHYWFFLKLKNDREINLENALEDDASDFRCTSFDQLISLAGDHKKHVYETLRDYFKQNILK